MMGTNFGKLSRHRCRRAIPRDPFIKRLSPWLNGSQRGINRRRLCFYCCPALEPRDPGNWPNSGRCKRGNHWRQANPFKLGLCTSAPRNIIAALSLSPGSCRKTWLYRLELESFKSAKQDVQTWGSHRQRGSVTRDSKDWLRFLSVFGKLHTRQMGQPVGFHRKKTTRHSDAIAVLLCKRSGGMIRMIPPGNATFASMELKILRSVLFHRPVAFTAPARLHPWS